MKVSGSRSAARSKPNARVRSATSRKTVSGGGMSGRNSKSSSSAEDCEDKPDRESLSYKKVTEILDDCSKLLLFNSVLEDPVVQNLLALLEAVYKPDDDDDDEKDVEEKAAISEAYREYFCALANTGERWSDWFLSLVLYSDNPFSLRAQDTAGRSPPDALFSAVKHDLAVLQKLYCFDPSRVADLVAQSTGSPVPSWTLTDEDCARVWSRMDEDEQVLRRELERRESSWPELAQRLQPWYNIHGSGIFSRHHFFLWDADEQEIVPVDNPDDRTLDDIIGNRRQKKMFRQNIEFLLAGLPTHHILLTGSRGSGKSSMVKSFVSSYAKRGLRLVEVDSVVDIESFRAILSQLKGRAQKFVLFVDDFNYDVDEDEYRCLRKLVDGSSVSIPSNVILCVTSFRFSDLHNENSASDFDRDEDFFADMLGFSDRFGTTLYFEEPSKEKYLDTVRYLAQRAGIGEIGTDILELRSLQFAKHRGGFCGRTARHFITFLTSEQSYLKNEMNDCRSHISRINEVQTCEDGAEAEESQPPPEAEQT